jgi:hypothetical protein
MIIDPKKRVLEKLAYRYWLKNIHRSVEENWKKAEQFLEKLEKRYKR